MDELWKNRKKPTPLDVYKLEDSHDEYKGSMLDWDQKPWSIQETIRVFKSSLQNLSSSLLAQRKINPEATLAFDKDDEDALNFVTASANLRAHVFGINPESRFKVKEMAGSYPLMTLGNIIPAIATTNAIIAGMIVLLAFKVLSGKIQDCKNTYLAYGGDRKQLLTNEQLESPNAKCQVCSSTYLQLEVNTQSVNLGYLIDGLIDKLGIPGEIMVEEGSRYFSYIIYHRLLYDVEFEDNRAVSLADLNIKEGSRLVITNDYDEEPLKNYSVILSIKDSQVEEFIIHGPIQLKTRPQIIPDIPDALNNSSKRKRLDENLQPNKKFQEIVVDDSDTIIL